MARADARAQGARAVRSGHDDAAVANLLGGELPRRIPQVEFDAAAQRGADAKPIALSGKEDLGTQPPDGHCLLDLGRR